MRNVFLILQDQLFHAGEIGGVARVGRKGPREPRAFGDARGEVALAAVDDSVFEGGCRVRAVVILGEVNDVGDVRAVAELGPQNALRVVGHFVSEKVRVFHLKLQPIDNQPMLLSVPGTTFCARYEPMMSPRYMSNNNAGKTLSKRIHDAIK